MGVFQRSVNYKRRSILGVFDFLTGGAQRGNIRPETPIEKEARTYDEIMDEIMAWNIDHTDILSVLQNEIEEERLLTWSHALEAGVRKGLTSASGKVEESPLFSIYLDLYQFVKRLRPKNKRSKRFSQKTNDTLKK